MNEKTNVTKLQAKTPANYIREFSIGKTELSAHKVPDDYVAAIELPEDEFNKKWSVDQYDDFVMDRTVLLSRKISDYLARLGQ
jgi:hypothetical protein